MQLADWLLVEMALLLIDLTKNSWTKSSFDTCGGFIKEEYYSWVQYKSGPHCIKSKNNMPHENASWKRAESVATLPPFGPIEGQKWFDRISSQWESQKNRFALIYFGKIRFLPPCIWNIPFVSYSLRAQVAGNVPWLPFTSLSYYQAIKRSKWESWSISCYLCPVRFQDAFSWGILFLLLIQCRRETVDVKRVLLTI